MVADVTAGDDAEGADGGQRTGLGAPQRVGAIAVPDTLTLGAARQIEVAREHVRWFPALVSNHVVDLLKKYPKEELPAELVTYVEDRKGYDYLHHAEVGSSNAAFVPDEITDRYCVVGAIKDHIAKLEDLQSLGVHQFNIYLMCGDEEKQVAAYGKQVIPHFNGKRRMAAAKPSPKTSKSKNAVKKSAKR